MRKTADHDRSGFTLVELILAAGVCAIVVAAAGGVFFSAVRLRDGTTRVVEENLPLERALTVVRRDLQGVMLSPSTNRVMSGTFRVGEVSSIELNQPVNIELHTTTGSLRDDEPWAEVQRVAYRLRDPADRTLPGKELVRSVTRNLLATTTPTPDEEVLLGGITSLEIECYDGSQWRNTWDTTLSDSNLPTAVLFRFHWADAAPNRPPLELLVPITVQISTNDASGTETNTETSATTP